MFTINNLKSNTESKERTWKPQRSKKQLLALRNWSVQLMVTVNCYYKNSKQQNNSFIAILSWSLLIIIRWLIITWRGMLVCSSLSVRPPTQARLFLPYVILQMTLVAIGWRFGDRVAVFLTMILGCQGTANALRFHRCFHFHFPTVSIAVRMRTRRIFFCRTALCFILWGWAATAMFAWQSLVTFVVSSRMLAIAIAVSGFLRWRILAVRRIPFLFFCNAAMMIVRFMMLATVTFITRGVTSPSRLPLFWRRPRWTSRSTSASLQTASGWSYLYGVIVWTNSRSIISYSLHTHKYLWYIRIWPR